MTVRSALEVATTTDTGVVRSFNEDAIATELDLGLAVVADGMGSRERGTALADQAIRVLVRAYYAAAGLYVVFAVLCGIFEWRVRRCRWLAACCALSAVIVPLAAGVWLGGLSVQEAYRGILLPTERYWLAIPSSALLSEAIRVALLLFFPVAAMAATWRRRADGSPVVPQETQTPNDRTDDAAETTARPVSGLRLAASWAALIVSAMVATVLMFDTSTKYSLLVAYSAEREQWADVLTYARRLPPSDAWNVFQVNRALYHRGELLERMFAYPQVADSVPTLTLLENVQVLAIGATVADFPAATTCCGAYQALGNPELAFIIIRPGDFMSDYRLVVSPSDLEGVGAESLDGVLVFAIVTIPADPAAMTANLQGPIIINPKNRKGRQAISLCDGHGVRHGILDEMKKTAARKG